MNISEKVKEIIKRKVDEFNSVRISQITEDDMLEYMIMEFDASTQEERHELAKSKAEARRKFLDPFIGSEIKSEDVIVGMNTAWDNGYTTGWMQFQWRKKSCQRLKREE